MFGTNKMKVYASNPRQIRPANRKLRNFYRNVFYGFMCQDIEQCIKARANYSVALLLMTYTEILGGLLTGNLGLVGHSKSNFNKGISQLAWVDDLGYYKNFRAVVKEKGEWKKYDIYKLVRCGLVHEYFVKGGGIVHNNSDAVDHCNAEDAGIGWINHRGKRVLRFHNNAYYRDFREGITKCETLLLVSRFFQNNALSAINRVKRRSVIEVT